MIFDRRVAVEGAYGIVAYIVDAGMAPRMLMEVAARAGAGKEAFPLVHGKK